MRALALRYTYNAPITSPSMTEAGLPWRRAAFLPVAAVQPHAKSSCSWTGISLFQQVSNDGGQHVPGTPGRHAGWQFKS